MFFKPFRLLLPLLGFILALLVSISSPATGIKTTEILWDNYGVPHIYGKDVPSSFRAFGWAQMHSHGNLLLRLYGQARGQAAEYWGEDYLDSDRWVLTMGIPTRAQEWYEAQSPNFRKNLDAFTAGINSYAQNHAELIDDEVEVVLPVNAVNLLAHLQRVLHFTFVVNQEQVAELQNEPKTANIKSIPTMGSNGWAIASKLSRAILSSLPLSSQIPFGQRFSPATATPLSHTRRTRATN
jgi:acyl-homoserine-lactone acylase